MIANVRSIAKMNPPYGMDAAYFLRFCDLVAVFFLAAGLAFDAGFDFAPVFPITRARVWPISAGLWTV
jgi:hypothetical protein